MKKLFILTFLLLLNACASVKPVANSVSQTTHVFEKNYTINADSTTFVGNSIVRVKDYYVTKTESPALTPTATFHITVGNITTELVEKNEYPIRGYVTEDGQEYAMMQIPRDDQIRLAIAVDSNGKPFDKTYLKNGFDVWVPSLFHRAHIVESLAHLDNVVKTKVDASRGYVNQELIYNGTDGKSVFLSYREFSPEDLARTAFFQNLTYEIKNEYIRFKNFRLKVLSSDTESIKFRVTEDGLAN